MKSSKTLPPARFGPLGCQADQRGDIVEPAHVELRAERIERDQVLLAGPCPGYSPSVM